MIPARYAATRFPGKLMQPLGSKSVIRHTYDNTLATGLFSEVIVVTDSDIILNEIVSNGGKAVMSTRSHESGTDRIAEAVEAMEADIIVNVQGDEPFVKKEPLELLLKAMHQQNTQVGSLMQEITDPELIADSNFVKVVVDKNFNALYFSRSAIPYARNRDLNPAYYEHIGVYAFLKQALLNFTSWPATPLESAEKIECLRFLENGISIRMVLTQFMGVEIDMPEDLERAARLL